jgi:hypothetical protein
MNTRQAIARLQNIRAKTTNKTDREALAFAIAELTDWLTTAPPEQIGHDDR